MLDMTGIALIEVLAIIKISQMCLALGFLNGNCIIANICPFFIKYASKRNPLIHRKSLMNDGTGFMIFLSNGSTVWYIGPHPNEFGCFDLAIGTCMES